MNEHIDLNTARDEAHLQAPGEEFIDDFTDELSDELSDEALDRSEARSSYGSLSSRNCYRSG